MRIVLLAAVCAAAQQFSAPAAQAQDLGLEVHRFQLDNGLTVLVHEDDKLPLAGVAVTYRVGSADEPEGRYGFAHLFEHLLFGGSQHAPDPWNDYLVRLGGASINGSTNFTKTDYFQIVPSASLESLLFLEADRMGFLSSELDQAAFDTERDVVKNELRERYGQPFSTAEMHRYEALYGPDHPFGHVIIGSEADLDAATLEDVQAWHEQYYGPNNAILAVAGDVELDEVRALVERYFGDIPPSGVTNTTEVQLPQRGANTSETVIDDNATSAYVERSWALPGAGSSHHAPLSIAASILGSGSDSRLHQALVENAELASSVSMNFWPEGAVTHLIISARVPDPDDVGRVENLMDAVIGDFLTEGPTAQELARIQNETTIEYASALQNVLVVALRISRAFQRTGDENHTQVLYDAFMAATPDSVAEAARIWLPRGWHTLRMIPPHSFSAGETQIDRTAGVPAIPEGLFLDVHLEGQSTTTLRNGMELTVIPRETAAVAARIVLPVGRARQSADSPGLAILAMEELGDRLDADEEFAVLGAVQGAQYSGEQIEVRVEAPAATFEAAFQRLLQQVFEMESDAEAVAEAARLTARRMREDDLFPYLRGVQHLPGRLYGADSDYAALNDVQVGMEAVEGYDMDDLRAFRDRWYRPDLAQTIVVGPASLDYAGMVEDLGLSNPRRVEAGTAAGPHFAGPDPRIVLVNRPGQAQSHLHMASVAPPADTEEGWAFNLARHMLGIRLNEVLREENGWTYGVGARVEPMRGERFFHIYSDIQSADIVAALVEARRVMAGYAQNEARDIEGFEEARARYINASVANLQTNSGLTANSAWSVSQGLSPVEMINWMERYRALEPADIEAIASRYFDPDRFSVVIYGDAEAIRDALLEAGFEADRIEMGGEY